VFACINGSSSFLHAVSSKKASNLLVSLPKSIMSGPHIPISTYRLQFNQDLRFNDVTKLIPYLHQLGVTDLYASPLLQAKRGSTHGYDVTDPSHLNPELGTDEEFDAMVRELQQHGMGLLLDIVPNHMAANSENPWWMDLLEDGARSPFASHFDVDWHPPARSLENRVLLPILGKPYSQVLEARELLLSYLQTGFFLNYFDFTLPIAARSYGRILGYRQDRLRRALGPESPTWQEFQGILAAVAQIPGPSVPLTEAPGERRQHREAIKERLWRLYTTSAEVKRFVDSNVRLFSGRKGVPSTFLLLDQLLNDQAYELAFWLTANEEIPSATSLESGSMTRSHSMRSTPLSYAWRPRVLSPAFASITSTVFAILSAICGDCRRKHTPPEATLGRRISMSSSRRFSRPEKVFLVSGLCTEQLATIS
jgi:Alpha amylase, catalytic domain